MSTERDDIRREFMIPSWCPVCERVMRSDKSTTTYIRFKCCVDCFIAFIEGREERWTHGWRPSPEDVTNYYSEFNR